MKPCPHSNQERDALNTPPKQQAVLGLQQPGTVLDWKCLRSGAQPVCYCPLVPITATGIFFV